MPFNPHNEPNNRCCFPCLRPRKPVGRTGRGPRWRSEGEAGELGRIRPCLVWAYSFTRLLNQKRATTGWSKAGFPEGPGGCWQFPGQGRVGLHWVPRGAGHGPWEHTGLGTWLLSCCEQRPSSAQGSTAPEPLQGEGREGGGP